MKYVISSTTRLNGSEKENEAAVRRGLEISSKWTRSEALIGKSIGDFTIDDLQRCIDTLNAEVAAAQAEVDALQAEIGRRKLGLEGQRNDDSDINAAVQAWLDDAPDCADRINALPVDERRKALARLGYDTPYYRQMFGLGRTGRR